VHARKNICVFWLRDELSGGFRTEYNLMHYNILTNIHTAIYVKNHKKNISGLWPIGLKCPC